MDSGLAASRRPGMTKSVMSGLDPGIHRSSQIAIFSMDCAVKPGNDENRTNGQSMPRTSARPHIALLLLAPLLAGCLERGKPTVVDTSGDDDAICRANNVAVGSSEYVACRRDRDVFRNNATARADRRQRDLGEYMLNHPDHP
jgi:hypothetical protein